LQLPLGIAEEVIPATFKKTDKQYEENVDEGPRREGGRGRGRGLGRGRGGQVFETFNNHRVVDSDVAEELRKAARSQPKKVKPPKSSSKSDWSPANTLS
jgi:hypothetical protein